MASGLYGVERPRSAAAPSPQDVTDRLRRLPPSARSVYGVLAERGPLTTRDLADVAGMPGRTVRFALRRLREEGVVGARCSLMDCRQCFFYVQDHCAGNGLHGVPVRLRGS